jgi:hypothetical protein
MTDVKRGWLKNGNRPGDFTIVLRCGAKTRRGTACRCPAMRNGRCRLHGGRSTGPTTWEGIERIKGANTKHGRYKKAHIAARRRVRKLLRGAAAALRAMCEMPRPI